MANYPEERLKVTYRITNKKVQGEELPHELFLIIRKEPKIRNALASNMSTNTKLRKAQISKLIQSRGSFGSWLGNLGKKVLKNNAIPFAIDKKFSCINWWCCRKSKTWNKKHEGGIIHALSAPLTASLVQPVITSVVKGITGRGVIDVTL